MSKELTERVDVALKRLDREALTEIWNSSVAADVKLQRSSFSPDENFTAAFVQELDIQRGAAEAVPSELVRALNEFREKNASVGVCIRLLRLLPLALAVSLESEPQDASSTICLRGHQLASECIVMLASSELGALDALAHIDPLTGLANKLAFDRDLLQWVAEGRQPFGMVFADMDGLKAINDTLGHEAGNAQIKRFAAALEHGLGGETWKLYRWAGDEHAALSLETDLLAVKEALTAVEAEFPFFSWGFVTLEVSDNNLRSLVRRADEAMYFRKNRRKMLRCFAQLIERKQDIPVGDEP